MVNINNIFLELIRVSIGTQDALSRPLSEKEWAKMYEMAKKQSLVGICFAGIQRLGADADDGFAKIGLSEIQYFTWMGMSYKIQMRNETVNKQCAELDKRLAADGYKSCVLKGQAVAAQYGALSNLRQPGDIDTWMVAKPKEVIEWARKTGKMYYYDYHHADLNIFESTEVELHYRPSLSRNLLRNSRLQNWFKTEGAKHIDSKTLPFSMPDYVFNVLLTVNHNFFHLLYEGVGMRQFLDMFFILKNCTDDSLRAEAWKLLKHMRLERFTRATMWMMKEVFGMDESYLLCEPDEGSGKFLLDEIMKAGNFGKFDERLKDNRYEGSRIRLMMAWMKHNLRLIKYYPADVLWTPIGILRISLWRRWHYRKETELKNME